FERWILEGTTDGHAKSADINRATLKAILDSALGLQPDDLSPQARAARTVNLKDFEGKTFIGKIGIEKGRPKNDGSGENWPDKNILAAVITKDKKDWHPVEQPPAFNGGGGGASSSTPPQSRPPLPPPGEAPSRKYLPPRPPPRGAGSGGARRRRRWHRGGTWGRPDGRPQAAWDADRAAEQCGVGVDHRRGIVRLDQQACRAGGRRAARHRANHPPDRARP